MTSNANFQVFQASAGSGKTFTIVKEYLKLCLGSEGQTDNFRHILAITFTNASANDMKAKIVNHLHEIIEDVSFEKNDMATSLMEELNLSEAELRRNALLLLTHIIHDYSSFCVSTIDAFVQKLSRTFARDLDLPSQYTVSIDNDEIAETITNNIGMQIGEENPFLVQLLDDFSDNQFANERNKPLQSELSDFVQKLMSEKAYQRDENNQLNDEVKYKQTLGFLNDKIRGFEQSIKVYVDQFKAVEQRFGLQTEDYWYKNSGVESFVNKLAKKDYAKPNSYLRKALDNRKCLNDLSKQEANEALLSILEPLAGFYEKEVGKYLFYKSQRDLLFLYALRTKIREEFARLAADEEVVHISEFNKLLNTVMDDFSVPFVYERIGEFFKHVFIDEFQDTSVLQWQNLLPLVDNGLSNGAMSMVVGDGKQSIYRFRSGEVEQIVQLPEIYALPKDKPRPVFLQYERNLKDNFIFHNLKFNFRSFENVVLFNNAFFEKARQQLSKSLQEVYKAYNEAYNKEVTVAQIPKKKEHGMVQVELYRPENQPDYCFERIETLIRELTETKGYRFEDITILTRKTDYGSEIANYLNDRGIPVISQESILLKASNKVQLLVNTLEYLLQPDNQIAIANMLYYRQLTKGSDESLDNLFAPVKTVAQGKTEVEPVLGIGEPGLFRELLSKSTCLYDLCVSLIRAYQLETLHDAFINYFLDEVFRFQNGLQEGIEEFLAYWDKKRDKLAVKSVSGNAVNIMTIHKSKGLEFNVVIYPEAIIDLDEKLNPSKSPEEWLSPEDLGFEPIPNMEKVLFRLNSSAVLMGEKPAEFVEKEKDSNRLDNLNLLYVAFTRAKQRLYILAKQRKDTKKPNLLEDFLTDDAITIDFKKVLDGDDALVYRFGDADFMKPNADMVDKYESVAPVDSVSMDWFQKINIDANPSMFWASPEENMQPREWGDLVHEILSKIRTIEDAESAFKPFLLEGTINKEKADFLRDKLAQISNCPEIAIAFSDEAKVKNECDILSNGIILRPDRYAELPDVIYLLDYKTGKKEKEHHDQLKRYIGALQGMVEKEIRAYLVYLSDPIEVEKVVMDTLF